MENICNVVINTEAFIVPDINEKSVRKYIDTINQYSKLHKEEWLSLIVSPYARKGIYESLTPPHHHIIKKIFDKYEIKYADPNTTFAAISSILETIFAENENNQNEITSFMHQNFTSNPDIKRLPYCKTSQDDLEYCVLLVAIARQHYPEFDKSYYLVLENYPEEKIEAKAQICFTSNIKKLPQDPDYFQGEALVLKDFFKLPEIIQGIDENQLFLKATNEIHAKIAIQIALFKSDPSVDWHKLNSKIPKIGKKLLTSYKENCMNRGTDLSQKILRAIVETIEGKKNDAVHHLRIDGGADNPKIKRESDKATACRRDVDRKIHLHYWKSGKVIELAYITGKHDDFCIPE